MTKNDRLIKYIASCNYNGTPVLPPDVNISNEDFTPVDEGIRFGLVGLRGVGSDVAQAIVSEREQNGPYKHIHDYVSRLSSKYCNHRVLEALVKAGAFDSTGYTRKQMWNFVENTNMLENARKHEREKASGQTTLFEMFDEDDESISDVVESVPEPDGVEWEKMEMLKLEKDIMNMYVTDNPVRPYMPQITDATKFNISQLNELDHGIPSGTFGGMVSDITTMRTKRGKLMSKFKLEDTTGYIEAICFNHENFAQQIIEDNIVLIKGKFEKGDRGNQIISQEVSTLTLDPNYVPKKQPANQNVLTQAFEIYINEADISEDRITKMNRALQNNFGSSEVFLNIAKADGKNIRAQMPFKVNVESSNLKPQISTIFSSARFN